MRRLTGVLGLMALLLTACPADESGTPRQAVAEAAERTAEVETARVAMTVEQETDGFGMTLSTEGVIDFVNERAEMRMDLPAAPEGAEAGGSITTIVDGDVVYTQIPLPEAPTAWVRVDPHDMPGMPEEGGLGAGPAGGQNPADSLDYLRGVTDEVTEEGSEQVRGVDTTRYEATVDLERVVEEAPEAQREHVRQSAERLGVDELPMTVWVDDEGRLRRLHYEVDLSRVQPPEASDGSDAPDDAAMARPQGTATITMELFDFGVDADITPPDEDEVTDFDELDLPAPGGAPPPPSS